MLLISSSIFRQIDYILFTHPNSCDGIVVMSCRYLVQKLAILHRKMTSTPGNLRVMYSEASVFSNLILNGHSEEYTVHVCLFNEEISFTTFG